MDGASNARGSGVEIVLISPKGFKLERSLRLGFRDSNIEVEYKALIAGLQVEMFSNSRLVVSQIDRSFKARDWHMLQYLKMFESLWVDL